MVRRRWTKERPSNWFHLHRKQLREKKRAHCLQKVAKLKAEADTTRQKKRAAKAAVLEAKKRSQLEAKEKKKAEKAAALAALKTSKRKAKEQKKKDEMAAVAATKALLRKAKGALKGLKLEAATKLREEKKVVAAEERKRLIKVRTFHRQKQNLLAPFIMQLFLREHLDRLIAEEDNDSAEGDGGGKADSVM